jgi:putative addiction module component (TIGR02574 family)
VPKLRPLTPEERLEFVEHILSSVAPSRSAIDAAWATQAAARMADDRGEVD